MILILAAITNNKVLVIIYAFYAHPVICYIERGYALLNPLLRRFVRFYQLHKGPPFE